MVEIITGCLLAYAIYDLAIFWSKKEIVYTVKREFPETSLKKPYYDRIADHMNKQDADLAKWQDLKREV